MAPVTRSGLMELLPPILEERAVDIVINVRGSRRSCSRPRITRSLIPCRFACAVSLAQSLCSLVPYLGKETATKILVPLIQQLCKVGELRFALRHRSDVLARSVGRASRGPQLHHREHR